MTKAKGQTFNVQAELSDTRQLYYEVVSQRNELLAENERLKTQLYYESDTTLEGGTNKQRRMADLLAKLELRERQLEHLKEKMFTSSMPICELHEALKDIEEMK